MHPEAQPQTPALPIPHFIFTTFTKLCCTYSACLVFHSFSLLLFLSVFLSPLSFPLSPSFSLCLALSFLPSPPSLSLSVWVYVWFPYPITISEIAQSIFIMSS